MLLCWNFESSGRIISYAGICLAELAEERTRPLSRGGWKRAKKRSYRVLRWNFSSTAFESELRTFYKQTNSFLMLILHSRKEKPRRCLREVWEKSPNRGIMFLEFLLYFCEIRAYRRRKNINKVKWVVPSGWGGICFELAMQMFSNGIRVSWK